MKRLLRYAVRRFGPLRLRIRSGALRRSGYVHSSETSRFCPRRLRVRAASRRGLITRFLPRDSWHAPFECATDGVVARPRFHARRRLPIDATLIAEDSCPRWQHARISRRADVLLVLGRGATVVAQALHRQEWKSGQVVDGADSIEASWSTAITARAAAAASSCAVWCSYVGICARVRSAARRATFCADSRLRPEFTPSSLGARCGCCYGSGCASSCAWQRPMAGSSIAFWRASLSLRRILLPELASSSRASVYGSRR